MITKIKIFEDKYLIKYIDNFLNKCVNKLLIETRVDSWYKDNDNSL